MEGLKIAVATNGPVPDNQCALKDAVLVAAAVGITDPAAIVTMAEKFFSFLVNPGAGISGVAQPLPPAGGGGQTAVGTTVQPQPQPPAPPTEQPTPG